MRIKRMALSEVKNGLSKVINEVQDEKEAVIITIHGHDAARIIPVRRRYITAADRQHAPRHDQSSPRRAPSRIARVSEQNKVSWVDINELAAKIREEWPEGITAEEVLGDSRD